MWIRVLLQKFIIFETWEDFLKVVYDWYTIFILHLKVTFRIDGLLTIIWSHDTANGKQNVYKDVTSEELQ